MQAILEYWPVIAFLTGQTIAAIWWASQITGRVSRMESDMTVLAMRVDKEIEANAEAAAKDGERLARIETLLSTVREAQQAMTERLEALIQKALRR